MVSNQTFGIATWQKLGKFLGFLENFHFLGLNPWKNCFNNKYIQLFILAVNNYTLTKFCSIHKIVKYVISK